MTAPVQVGPSPQGGGPVPSAHHMRVYPRTLAAPPRTSLTGRQIQILRLAANGNTNRAIGRELGISEESVKTHMQGILRKLRVGDRAQAVAVALRLEVLKLEEIAIPRGANYDCRHDA
ncbi:LuxR C-terminal-related transcriptional regulator [Streptomyces sp. NPDC055966]|uniref:helix-turn-helix domain-containing protein n=1 Tax=Streptomyces sp. NPDC055966 TaxID=3345669 RepID=UPI0035DB648D